MTKSTIKTIYNAKLFVFVRFIVEILTFLACGILPIVFWFSGFFAHQPWFVGPGALCLSVIAWVILPFYGLLVLSVSEDVDGIRVFSIFKRRFCAWEEMKSLTLTTNWNWKRYVLVMRDGEDVTVPIWLKGSETLADQIRARLPKGSALSDDKTQFSISFISAFMLLLTSWAAVAFCALVWVFVCTNFLAKRGGLIDKAFVVIFVAALSGMFLVRIYFVALLPIKIQLTEDGIVLRTLFFKRKLPWITVRKLALAPAWLPSGYLVTTTQGRFLIADSVEACDELAKKIQERARDQTSA